MLLILPLLICPQAGVSWVEYTVQWLMARQDFSRYQSLLVHDPASSLRTGDIVSISPGFRASKHVRHVVNSILAPFGEPIEDRPPIPSEEERWIAAHNKKVAKDARRAEVKRQLDEVVAAVVGEELGTKEVDWKQKGRQEKMKKKKRSDRQTAVLGSRPIERENTASRKVDFKS